MIKEDYIKETRSNKIVKLDADLVVVGGGMAGVCASITAARAGTKVVLVQDRPVLGGNASSEVRLWILGATSHMGNNNRWAREGGVIDEILLENVYRNKEGNTLIFDTILLEKVTNEPNIKLLLNTAVYNAVKSDDHAIREIMAFCSQNSTEYHISGSIFCDASGDGILSFLAGAAFRMGAETRKEFGEKFAPDHTYGELLGHTLYFYSKEADHPVKYTPPSFALKDIKAIPRYKILSEKEYGCRLWWIEYGGRRDTVHETEEIKWELWKVVYGIWDHIKNSGEYKDTENLTLEWVGMIPGKRESRRFEGLYMLKQQDIVEQREFDDAVAFGGWAIDLHPADGVYSDLPGCNQWHTKGIYQIPLRSYISRDIHNLFYAGRIISASHVAFGSSRVMATCAHGGQAVGMAASLCIEESLLPKELCQNGAVKELQRKLNLSGQSIPGIPIGQKDDLMSKVTVRPSSTLVLDELPFDGPWISLEHAAAQMLPFEKGGRHSFRVLVNADEPTNLTSEFRVSSKAKNYTPDVVLATKELKLSEGEQFVDIDFGIEVPETQYGFVTFLSNEKVKIKGSMRRLSGILSVFNKIHKAVSNNGVQVPPGDIGVDSFEFWKPDRRPDGHNVAMQITPAIEAYKPDYLKNGFTRPYLKTNAWMAAMSDTRPRVELQWPEPVTISRIQIHFDTDFDHPLESSLMGHPEEVMPFVVSSFTIRKCNDEEIYRANGNYQTIREMVFDEPITTAGLKLDLEHPSTYVPAAVFEIICS